MLEHVGYSQAPGPGTSFSGVTGNGAPNAHYYHNPGKATAQQHNTTTNNHHQRLNGTGNSNNTTGGANTGMNASISSSTSASTTTTTTNTNTTTSNGHGHGTNSKGGAGAGGGGGSITVTVTATTTTTTTATATATANTNANTNTHPAATGTAPQDTPSSGAKKIKTKRTKRAFAPHAISASRPASEKITSASSSPVTCKHALASPKFTSRQEKTSAKLEAEGGSWSSPVKRTVSCVPPSVPNAGRSASPALREQQRSSSNKNSTTTTNGTSKRTSLPTSANQFAKPPHTPNSQSQKKATDMPPVTSTLSELRKDRPINASPKSHKASVNGKPKTNGIHKEIRNSPSSSLSHSDGGGAKPKVHKARSTPNLTTSKSHPTKSSGPQKETRPPKSNSSVVQTIEIRSPSSTPRPQFGARPPIQQESTQSTSHAAASHLDQENGTPNGVLGKRKHDSIASSQAADTSLSPSGRMRHTIIKKVYYNGVPYTAMLVTSHDPFKLPNGYTLEAQSPAAMVNGNGSASSNPILVVDGDNVSGSATPVAMINKDANAGLAGPVIMANGTVNSGSASPVVMANGEGGARSRSPIMMISEERDASSESLDVMMNGYDDVGSGSAVIMVDADDAGSTNQIFTMNGNGEAGPSTPPRLANGIPNLAPSKAVIRLSQKKLTFDSDAFDTLIYSQPGALAPPEGVGAPTNGRVVDQTPPVADLLCLHRNPAIQGMHERSDDWYRKKLSLRPPGSRKQWFGKVRERQRWLRTQQDKLSRPSDSGLRDRVSKRKDPEPWTYQKSMDFGDVPEDDLPSYVKENPAWLKFCGRLRDARTRMDTVDSSLQWRERAKRKEEIDEKTLSRKEVAQRRLASKCRRQTEEFYNSMKQGR